MTALIETTAERLVVPAHSTEATAPTRVRVPLVMPTTQTYYWSVAWQRAEAESLADYAAGRYVESSDPNEVIRWLDEPDDDDA